MERRTMSCALSSSAQERSVHRLSHGLPDFSAAIGALIDEVDLGHAPVRLDVAHIHGQHPHAAWTDDGSHLEFVMVDKGWHIGSPSQPARSAVNLNPGRSLIPDVV